jgi:hypothetical protein
MENMSNISKIKNSKIAFLMKDFILTSYTDYILIHTELDFYYIQHYFQSKFFTILHYVPFGVY